MARIRSLVIGSVMGAALAYFLDPELGPARRARALDQVGAGLRRLADRARGAAIQLDVASAGQADDDLTVLSRVEGVLLGVPDFPRGSVNAELVDGRLVLRGEAASEEQVGTIVRAAARVRGVTSVESLLRVRGAQDRARQARAQ